MQNVAQRSGFATSRFLRRFKDKRDVLFGEDALPEPLPAGIAAAPPQAGPLQAMAYALDAVGQKVFMSGRRSAVARGRAVIDAHPGLQEREGLKSRSLAAALSAARECRGAPGLPAEVSAHLGGSSEMPTATRAQVQPTSGGRVRLSRGSCRTTQAGVDGTAGPWAGRAFADQHRPTRIP